MVLEKVTEIESRQRGNAIHIIRVPEGKKRNNEKELVFKSIIQEKTQTGT